MLNTVHKSFTCFRERKVHLVRLQLQIIFPLNKLAALITQMLSSLLKCVRAQSGLSLLKTSIYIFQLLSLRIDVLRELGVFLLQPLVLISLLGVQVVELGFISKINLGNLLLITRDLVFHITFFSEKSIKMLSLFIILVSNMDVKRFNILGLCI